MQKYGIVSFLILFFLILSNNYFTVDEAIKSGYNDINSYLFIAESTLGLSNYSPQGIHHIERWPIHYFVGTISSFTNLDLIFIYRFLVIAILVLFIFLINTIDCAEKNKIIILAMIFLNPYSFRTYLASPIMLADCIFFFSIGLITISIIKNKSTWLLAGCFFAIISRQTALLIVPVLFIFLLFSKISKKTFILSTLVISTFFLSIKYTTPAIYELDDEGYFVKHVFGLFIWIFDSPNFSQFFNFFGRYILFLMTLFPISLLIFKNIKVKKDSLFLFAFLFLHVQPILGGPLITSGNIQRLSSFSIPFLIGLIQNKKINKYVYLTILSFSLLNSFHHDTSILINLKYSNIVFISLISFSMLFILFQLVIKRKN